MQKIRIIICFLIITMFSVACDYNDKEEVIYTVIIESYTENGSYIEYPQIKGLKDEKKETSINLLLKEQVYTGAINYSNEPFVDFSDSNYVYEFESGVGLKSSDIASFWYSFDAYGEIHLDDDAVIRDTSRFFCITLDMNTGEIIDLTDFMVVDESLIHSTDGSNIETDYNSAVQPTFHKFKDAFMVYTSEEERDAYHIFTSQEVIALLTNPDGETNWYIDEDKRMVFFFNNNFIGIPYIEVEELIYPKYLNILNDLK